MVVDSLHNVQASTLPQLRWKSDPHTRSCEVAYEYVQFKNRLENKNQQLEEMEETISASNGLGFRVSNAESLGFMVLGLEAHYLECHCFSFSILL